MILQEVIKNSDFSVLLDKVYDAKSKFSKEIYSNAIKEMLHIKTNKVKTDLTVVMFPEKVDIETEETEDSLIVFSKKENSWGTLELIPWKEAMQLPVSEKSVEQYKLEDIAALAVIDLTTFGRTAKEAKDAVEEIIESIDYLMTPQESFLDYEYPKEEELHNVTRLKFTEEELKEIERIEKENKETILSYL